MSIVIALLIALFKHLRQNDGHIVLPSVIKRENEKFLKPGVFLDIFLTVIPALIGVIVFGSDVMIVNIIVAIIASDYGMRIYGMYVKQEIIELQNLILNVLRDSLQNQSGTDDNQ